MILDASAPMAFLLKEKGAKIVLDAILSGARMSVVNISEVVGRYVLKGATREDAVALVERLPFELLSFDADTALEAGSMAKASASVGLSLGDRCCLATAKRHGVAALTADRVWATVADRLGVEVVLIR